MTKYYIRDNQQRCDARQYFVSFALADMIAETRNAIAGWSRYRVFKVAG